MQLKLFLSYCFNFQVSRWVGRNSKYLIYNLIKLSSFALQSHMTVIIYLSLTQNYEEVFPGYLFCAHKFAPLWSANQISVYNNLLENMKDCAHSGHLRTLFYDLTRDSIANNFVIDVYCRCLEILYQIAINCKI